MNCVFYVSGHGFGHASRDIAVIQALLRPLPQLKVLVRSSAPRWLFDRAFSHGDTEEAEKLRRANAVTFHHAETDTGIVQIDSLHLDADQTVRRAQAFMDTFASRVDEEAAWLRTQRAALVIADIPPLGIAAARAADVPAVALGNFTWDWIYSAYPSTEALVLPIAQAYASADVALRLPMHGGFDSFARVIDLPLIARSSRRDPRDTRVALGLPLDELLVLVSFGGYGLAGLDLDALTRLDGYVVLVSGQVPLGHLPDRLRGGRRGSLLPFDEQRMYAAGYRYEDLVRAVDVVVTKPGYGIISECAANDTALLFTSRGHFSEYDVLVQAMAGLVRSHFIAHGELFAGDWAPALNALLAQPAVPERARVDGAEVAADYLLERYLRVNL